MFVSLLAVKVRRFCQAVGRFVLRVVLFTRRFAPFSFRAVAGRKRPFHLALLSGLLSFWLRNITVWIGTKGLFGLLRGVATCKRAVPAMKRVTRQCPGAVMPIMVTPLAVTPFWHYRYLVVRFASWLSLPWHLAVRQGTVVKRSHKTGMLRIRGPVSRTVIDRKWFRFLVCGLLVVSFKLATPLSVLAAVVVARRSVWCSIVRDFAACKTWYN